MTEPPETTVCDAVVRIHKAGTVVSEQTVKVNRTIRCVLSVSERPGHADHLCTAGDIAARQDSAGIDVRYRSVYILTLTP